jgi:hypothetical protein
MASDNSALTTKGDFTGNGNIEFLRTLDQPTSSANAAAGNQIYAWTFGGPADRLSTTNSESERLSIRWSNTLSTDVPQPPSHLSDRGTANAAVYPNVDIAMPLFVVKYTQDNFRNSSTTYDYFGLKMSYKDLSVLGFREVRRTVAGGGETPLTYMTQFVQNGTNTGSVSVAETRIEPATNVTARLLARTTNVYCDMTAAAGAQATASYLAPCPTAAKVRQPYLYTTKSEAWDLTGAALPVETQANTYNRNGDITESLVKREGTALGIFQSFTRSVVNAYHPDNIANDNWMLGKLKTSTTQTSVPNSIGSIATSAGSAPNAAATSGTGTVNTPPPTPSKINWLVPVLNLLLED